MKPGKLRIGILGGGQLGKMLVLEALKWDLEIWVLDKSKDFPAASVCSKFIEGDFSNFDDVYAFGKQVNVLTIEIEHVNTAAMLQLKREGLTIHPSPESLSIIQDKGLQKEFYRIHKLPSAPFYLWNNKDEILMAIGSSSLIPPFVQKSRTSGYDGRGVELIREKDDLAKLLSGKSLTEELIPIDKEIAVIVSRNEKGEVAAFPPVDMVFEPEANLVEFVRCPADICPNKAVEAVTLAVRTIEAFGICGLLAVEMFISKDGDLLINEVAPRPHNSGHITIDNSYTSQFEQHLRAILNLPLGSTKIKTPAVMVNILGAAGYTGTARYKGWEESLAVEGAKIHLYGKTTTKPLRKMGHVTVLDELPQQAMLKAEEVKNILTVIA